MGLEAAARLAQAHALDPRERFQARRAGRQAPVYPQHLLQLVAHGAQRMQRAPRALEHEADAAPAQPLPCGGVGRALAVQQVTALETQPPRPHLRARIEQAGQRERGDRLARAALADQSQRFTGVQGEADVVEHVHQARGRLKAQAQALGLHQRRAHAWAASAAPRGSSRSRSASPSSVKQPTAANSASPGKKASHHWPVMM